jgi:hypothetical protein
MREEFVVKRHRAIGAAALGLLLAVTAFPAFAVPGQDPPREALVKRLSAEAPSARLLVPLTGLLLDYVESVIPAAKLSDLFASENAAEFLRRLRFVTGKDLLDIGADMFGHYEKKAPPDPGGAWTKIPAGPFRLYIRPGSAADRDRDLIARDVIETAARVAEGLDLSPSFDAVRALLVNDESEKSPGPGLIPLYIHASRNGDGAEKIGKSTYGNASLGATIVDRRGRMTFRINVLYFNALFLAVLEHEVAHAVVLLSTFDPKELLAREIAGEADLRKAFMAGYRPIPALLQEGLGDWAFYYKGFHAAWGLLPPPEAMVMDLRMQGKTLPLKDILTRSAAFRAQNSKAYSLEAASFLEFLFRTKGRDTVKRWLFTPGADAAKSFESVLGLKVADAERLWLAAGEKRGP